MVDNGHTTVRSSTATGIKQDIAVNSEYRVPVLELQSLSHVTGVPTSNTNSNEYMILVYII